VTTPVVLPSSHQNAVILADYSRHRTLSRRRKLLPQGRLLGVTGYATLISLLVGCDTGSSTAPSGLSGTHRPAEGAYLTYGVAVPVGQELLLPPEPYNPKKHGRAIPNTSPLANWVDRPGFTLPPAPGARARYALSQASKGLMTRSDPLPPPGTGDRGLFLVIDTIDWYGVSVINEIRG
jgi:hypothetical protein